MLQINKVNKDGFIAYDVYINGKLLDTCNSYYEAVAAATFGV